jgi:hypothetical protein
MFSPNTNTNNTTTNRSSSAPRISPRTTRSTTAPSTAAGAIPLSSANLAALTVPSYAVPDSTAVLYFPSLVQFQQQLCTFRPYNAAIEDGDVEMLLQQVQAAYGHTHDSEQACAALMAAIFPDNMRYIYVMPGRILNKLYECLFAGYIHYAGLPKGTGAVNTARGRILDWIYTNSSAQKYFKKHRIMIPALNDPAFLKTDDHSGEQHIDNNINSNEDEKSNTAANLHSSSDIDMDADPTQFISGVNGNNNMNMPVLSNPAVPHVSFAANATLPVSKSRSSARAQQMLDQHAAQQHQVTASSQRSPQVEHTILTAQQIQQALAQLPAPPTPQRKQRKKHAKRRDNDSDSKESSDHSDSDPSDDNDRDYKKKKHHKPPTKSTHHKSSAGKKKHRKHKHQDSDSGSDSSTSSISSSSSSDSSRLSDDDSNGSDHTASSYSSWNRKALSQKEPIAAHVMQRCAGRLYETFKKEIHFNHARNHKECLALCVVIEAMLKKRCKITDDCVEIAVRRLVGVQMADATNNWGMCDELEAEGVSQQLLPNKTFKRMLANTSRLKQAVSNNNKKQSSYNNGNKGYNNNNKNKNKNNSSSNNNNNNNNANRANNWSGASSATGSSSSNTTSSNHHASNTGASNQRS